mgnify:CR=1 FL=1
MAKKKEVEEIVPVVEEIPAIESVPTKIGHLSVDFGREDLNTMGRKINEIIDHINK